MPGCIYIITHLFEKATLKIYNINMLMTVDIGNSSVKLGIYENNSKKYFLIIDKQNEYRKMILNFLYRNGLSENLIKDVIICSVDNYHLSKIYNDIKNIFNIEPKIINSKDNYGINLSIPNPNELSNDIIVMASYVASKYNTNILIESFSTTTTFIYISEYKALRNYIILPGFNGYSNLISEKTSLRIDDLSFQNSFKAETNAQALGLGVINGYIGMCNYLTSNLLKELNIKPLIIACGGCGKSLIPYFNNIDVYEADLVSDGLNYIYNKYYK